jgi:hypothetical protein
MDVTRDPEASTAAASNTCLGVARSRGVETTIRIITGEPFWSSTEIVRIADLVDSTVDMLSGMTPREGSIASTPYTGLRQ